MKKFLTALLALTSSVVLLFGVSACGNNGGNDTDSGAYQQVTESQWKRIFQDSAQSTNLTMKEIYGTPPDENIMHIFKVDGNLFNYYNLNEHTTYSETLYIYNPQNLTINSYNLKRENSEWEKDLSLNFSKAPKPKEEYYKEEKNRQNLLYQTLCLQDWYAPTYDPYSNSLDNYYNYFTFNEQAGLYTATFSDLEETYDISIGIKGGKVVYYSSDSTDGYDSFSFKYEIEYGKTTLTVPNEIKSLL